MASLSKKHFQQPQAECQREHCTWRCKKDIEDTMKWYFSWLGFLVVLTLVTWLGILIFKSTVFKPAIGDREKAAKVEQQTQKNAQDALEHDKWMEDCKAIGAYADFAGGSPSCVKP